VGIAYLQKIKNLFVVRIKMDPPPVKQALGLLEAKIPIDRLRNFPEFPESEFITYASKLSAWKAESRVSKLGYISQV
jgi:hypothetical protein